MVIPVVKEEDYIKDQFFGEIERCYFCSTQCLYWHENTNNPVCKSCAKKHKVAELPDYGKKIRAAKRKLAAS